jgi:hypothetical protein
VNKRTRKTIKTKYETNKQQKGYSPSSNPPRRPVRYEKPQFSTRRRRSIGENDIDDDDDNDDDDEDDNDDDDDADDDDADRDKTGGIVVPSILTCV